MRYFLAQSSAYAAVAALLDAATGIPRPGTERFVPAPDFLLRSPDGRVAVSVPAALCEIPAVKMVLAAALRSGSLVEINEATIIEFARAWSPKP